MAKKSKSFLKQKKTFSGSQILLFVLAFAAVGSVAIWQSLAAPHNGGGGGKPPRGGNDTIALSMVTDQNSDGLPNYGDTVTFNVSSSATTEPHARLQCMQSGGVIYSNQAGFYPSYPWPWLQNMTLNWTSGGAADCTAQIYYFSGSKTVWSTSLNFHVNS